MTDAEREQLRKIADGVVRIEQKLDDHLESHRTVASTLKWVIGSAIAIGAIVVSTATGCG